MSRKTNYTTIPSGYVSFYIMDGNGNDVNGNNATSDNVIWVSSTAGYGVQELSWGSSTTFTYSSITYTNSYLIKNGQVIKNSSEVSNTALSGINGAYYQGLIFYNRTLSNSEELAIQQYASRKFGPTRGLKNNNIFVGSLPNLEQGKVFEISKPQVSGTYYDQTGNGHNGTATNVSDSQIGQANVMSFNGSSSYITLTTNTDIQPASGKTITVCCWINTTQAPSVYGMIWNGGYQNGTPSNSSGFIAIYNSGIIRLTGDGTDIVDTQKHYNDGKWHFVSVIIRSAYSQIYVDGILQASGSINLNSGYSNYSSGFGHLIGDKPYYFDGEIYQPIVYNKLLSPIEIQQLYYSQKGNFIN